MSSLTRKIKIKRAVTPVELPDLVVTPKTDLVQEVTVSSDEENPDPKEETKAEEENPGVKFKTFYVKSETPTNKYQENTESPAAGKYQENTGMSKTTPIIKNISQLGVKMLAKTEDNLPQRTGFPDLDEDEQKEEELDEEQKIDEEFLTDQTEELYENIELLKEELGCELCDTNAETVLITAIRLCFKCKNSLLRKRSLIYKWIAGIVFVVMLIAIIILSSFLIVIAPKYIKLKDNYDALSDKYEHLVTDIKYYKKSLSETQVQMNVLFSSLSSCKGRDLIHQLETQIKTCEASIYQIKEDFIRSLNTNIKPVYYQDFVCKTQKYGDWTLIHDQSNLNLKGVKVYIPIDDHDLQYTQLLFISHGNQYLDYNYGEDGGWYSEGFNFQFNYFAFENYNIVIKAKPGDYYFNTITNNSSFKLLPANNLETLKFSKGRCQKVVIELIKYCATEFIIHLPNDAGRIKGISDIETFFVIDLLDDEFNYDFQLYVK